MVLKTLSQDLRLPREKSLENVMIGIVIISSAIMYHFIWKGIESSTGEVSHSLFDSFYFSVVTFTTLGFGDLRPISNNNLMKLWASGEAFIGAFLIALFVVVIAKRMIR
jgi:hypothetical protein